MSRPSQDFTGAHRAIEPALRLFVRGLARPSISYLAALAIPHPGIDKPEHPTRAGIHGQHRVQQKAAQGSALANWPIAVRLRPPPSQRQFTRILDHDTIA